MHVIDKTTAGNIYRYEVFNNNGSIFVSAIVLKWFHLKNTAISNPFCNSIM